MITILTDALKAIRGISAVTLGTGGLSPIMIDAPARKLVLFCLNSFRQRILTTRTREFNNLQTV